MVNIAVLIMVKNEHKRLHVTLESIKNFADSLIIYDTGSTDDTIQICKDFSELNKITLRLKEGEFVNFSDSRNVGIDFADSFDDVQYILMLDVNDELRGGDKLRQFAEENVDSEKSAFLVQQQWWSGSLNKYYNTRFIKARTGWRYQGVVHEYLHNDSNINDKILQRIQYEDIILYQDRNQDDDKTGKRFIRDEKLLKAEYLKDPTEPRTVFYLAQTYSCLNDFENAYYYYKVRTTLIGFYEERFHSCLKCGEMAEKIGLDWYDSFSWYMKAYELITRVEPLLKIGEYYQRKQNWLLATTFFELACRLKYPESCILFVDRLSYEYRRWHLYSIVAYYADFFKQGEAACKTAIEAGPKNGVNIERDIKNLEIYQKRIKEIENPITETVEENAKEILVNNILTKKEFMKTKYIELKKEFPDITEKQLDSRLKLLWKNKK